jgi:hypothetical protein
MIKGFLVKKRVEIETINFQEDLRENEEEFEKSRTCIFCVGWSQLGNKQVDS